MSTIGENVQRMPLAAASIAATREAFSTIEGSRLSQSQGNGKFRLESVDHVEAKQNGNVQPRLLHRNLLIFVDLARIDHVEQRTDLPRAIMSS